MAYYVLLSFVFLSTGISQDVVPANFPSCANDCLSKFTNGTFTGSCANADAACICEDSTFQNDWACCVNTGCGESDESTTIGIMNSQCPKSENIGKCDGGRDPGTGFGRNRGGNRFGGGNVFGGGGNNGNGNGDGGDGGQSSEKTQVSTRDPVTVTQSAITVVSPVTVNNPVTVVNPTTIDIPVTISTPAETMAVAVPFNTVSPANTAPTTAAPIPTSTQEAIVPSLAPITEVPSEFPPILLSSTSSPEQPFISETESLVTTAIESETTSVTMMLFTTQLFDSISPIPTSTPPSPALDPTDTSAPRPSKPTTDGQKAGVAIAVLVTVVLMAAGIFFFVRWRRREIDKEFEELKEQHEADKSRPKSTALPVIYPRTDTTITGGIGAYRDVFEKPGTGG